LRYFSEEADKMVVLQNLEFGQLANTLWFMLHSNHMSGLPLQDLFSRQDESKSLQLLKLYIENLLMSAKLDPSTLYIHKLRLVKASQGFEHETVVATVKCTSSESQWELAFDRSQSSSLHDDNASDTSSFEYPPGPRGNTMEMADSSLQSLKITGRPATDSVTFLYPYSALAKQDAIAEIHFPTPSPSLLRSFILEPSDLGKMQDNHPLFLISFINLVQPLHQDYNLLSTNCFWISRILFRACAAYFRNTSDTHEQDFGYAYIPITDPPLEDKLDTVISKWKMANQEFINSDVSKS